MPNSGLMLRLLADDLTGALDSAAGFVGRTGAVPTAWQVAAIAGRAGALAFDSASRELDPDAVPSRLAALAGFLAIGDPAFKKLDSLLRGHEAQEIALCVRLCGFDHVVIAPAFPAQGRITRGGTQLRCDANGAWSPVGSLAGDLAGYGVAPSLRRAGDRAPAGISLWDAASDADLDAIVAAGRALPGKVLWCGAGGLAAALAGRYPAPVPRLPAPLLALIGSRHPVSAAQLAAVGERHRRVAPEHPATCDTVAITLAAGNAAISVAIEDGMAEAAAADLIDRTFATLARGIPRPGTLFVAGGETLRRLCDALGAALLMVDGELAPGIPTSTIIGGLWDGVRVVSKSGAFGDAGLLARLFDGTDH